MSNDNNNTYLIAGSIIIAGLLIAVGAYVSKSPQNGNGNDTEVSEDYSIEAVTEADHIKGQLDAELIIVEYSDTECPYCKGFHGVLDQLTDEYPAEEVSWVYRHFPLGSIHPKAPAEAHATECAFELGGNEGFWTYINRVYEVTPSNNGLDLAILPDIAEFAGLDRDEFEACQNSGRHLDKIEAQFQDAVQAGGTGTPFNVFVLNRELSENAITELEALRAQYGPSAVRISKDNTMVAVGGSLSYEATANLVNIMLDK